MNIGKKLLRLAKASVARRSDAFSVTELLVWLALVAALMAILLPGFGMVYNKVKRFRTDVTMSRIEQAVNMYSLGSTGRAPASRDGGLRALYFRPEGKAGADWSPQLDGSTVKFVGDGPDDFAVMDGFGEAFEYNSPPKVAPDRYKQWELISYGGDENNQTKWSFKGK